MHSHRPFTLAFVLTACSLTLLQAQAPAGASTSSAFEVVSVKPNKSGTTQTNISMQPDGIRIINLPLGPIIQLAYGINQPSKLVGIPDWTATERFNVTARAAGPINLDQRRLMMQAMLADRFKLVARMEKHEVSVLALMPARNDGKLGPKLVESKGCIEPRAAAQQAAAQQAAPAGPDAPVCGPKPGGAGHLILIGSPMQQFTAILGLMVSQTVADKTGLTGRYDIDLTYTPDRPMPAGIPAGVDIPAADPNGPTLYTALREQLGLKLESKKEQEEVLVITSIERPTEN